MASRQNSKTIGLLGNLAAVHKFSDNRPHNCKSRYLLFQVFIDFAANS